MTSNLIFVSDCIIEVDVGISQPTFEELHERFKGGIDRRYRTQIPVSVNRCKTKRKTRHVTAMLVELEQDLAHDEIALVMRQYRLRPALFEELLAFERASPPGWFDRGVVALGSEIIDQEGVHCYPIVHSSDLGGVLRLGLITDLMTTSEDCLAIRA